MRICFAIFFLISLKVSAQDKLFLKNGTLKEGEVLSVGTDYIFFKHGGDTSVTTYKIPKNLVSLIEKYDGRVFIFGQKNTTDSISEQKIIYPKNSLQVQPLNIFTGRITFAYEYLNKQQNIGFCPVLSISFDPVGIIYKPAKDTTYGDVRHKQGVNFIGGGDINFYLTAKQRSRFFIGPRVRYGVDMFANNTEAYSLQTQFGWRFGNASNWLSQHLSFGFGFVRILSLQGLNGINPKQSYGWASINYRIGVNW